MPRMTLYIPTYVILLFTNKYRYNGCRERFITFACSKIKNFNLFFSIFWYFIFSFPILASNLNNGINDTIDNITTKRAKANVDNLLWIYPPIKDDNIIAILVNINILPIFSFLLSSNAFIA